MLIRKRGQTSLEFVAVIIIVLGAFLAIGNYFKRGIQGRWKTAVDEVGEQYDPRVANGDVSRILSANSSTAVTSVDVPGGSYTIRTDQSESTDIKRGFIRVGAY